MSPLHSDSCGQGKVQVLHRQPGAGSTAGDGVDEGQEGGADLRRRGISLHTGHDVWK